jgi:hypothetical protein
MAVLANADCVMVEVASKVTKHFTPTDSRVSAHVVPGVSMHSHAEYFRSDTIRPRGHHLIVVLTGGIACRAWKG